MVTWYGLPLMQTLIFVIGIYIAGGVSTDCTNRIPSSLPNNPENESKIDDSIASLHYGYYFFPLFKFQCIARIEKVIGYFLINSRLNLLAGDVVFYFQIWRPNSHDASLTRVYQLGLQLSDAICSDTNCFINYTLQDDFEVENNDLIGFYTSNNSVIRPLFYSYDSQVKTRVNLLESRHNNATTLTRENIIYLYNISYPQINVQAKPTNNIDEHGAKHFLVLIILVVIIGSCVAVSILVLTILHQRKRKSRQSPQYDYGAVRRTVSYNSLKKQPWPYEEPFRQPLTSLEITTQLQMLSMEVSSDSVQVGHEIGSGQFGVVLHGVWSHDQQDEQVAIKKFRGDVSENKNLRLLKEAAIIGQFAHNNVIKLKSVCGVVNGVVTGTKPVMILLEYLPNGDLLSFLKSKRIKEDDPIGRLTPKMLLQFANDIVCGMNYLSNKCFVHRDLAARNVLLTKDNVCKIADFGLARDFNRRDCYKATDGIVPVKWTAPEAISDNTFTTASDVWSFGVVLYEIWSLGQVPLKDCVNGKVLTLLNSGYRLPPPPGCPRPIYSVMIQCWHPTPELRPVFSNLLHAVSQPHYVMLNLFEEDRQAAGEPECHVLGAPLTAGYSLFLDLQNTYR